MKEVDYIIVGQGLAGSVLAHTLMTKNKSVLVISDLQAPFQHKDTIAFLVSIWNEMGGADEVVIIGDLIDNYYGSSFANDPAVA